MPQAHETELFRVEPDRPTAPPPDIGIHSWPIGSYMPMGFYRPVPIVRFTATIVFQSLANLVLHALLYELPGVVTVGTCVLVALVLARRAFARWLGQASAGWKVATLATLALNLLLVSLAGLSPARSVDGPNAVLLDFPSPSAIEHHFRPG